MSVVPRPVFVHGAGRTPASWGPQLARFEGSVAVALPGHPEGEPLDSAAGLAGWLAGEIADVPGPLVFVGHSLGGAVALELAVARPDLVAGLVLVATGARLPVPDHALRRLRDDLHAECARVVEASWAEHHPELIARGIAAMEALGERTIAADYRAAGTFDLRGRLDEVRVPALVVSGERDPLTPRWMQEELAGGLPMAAMAVVPEAAHVPQLEQAVAVDLLIAGYLARLELTLADGG